MRLTHSFSSPPNLGSPSAFRIDLFPPNPNQIGMSMIQRPRAFQPTDGNTLSRPTRTSITDPAVVSTLPFDPVYVRRNRTEEVLRRTVRRWVWFDEARKIEPTLGTLSYLPPEIRRSIWETALQCKGTLSAEGLWEYENVNCSPFNLSAYYFGFGRRWSRQDRPTELRLASSSVRAEFDDIFLSKLTFRFNRPENLNAFIKHLTRYQLSRLQSFEIGLSVCVIWSLGVWLESMARLPCGLQLIHFRVYPAYNGWFYLPGANPCPMYHREIGREEFDILDALVKQAVQRASKARVTICSAVKDRQLSMRCQGAVDAIIAKNRQQRPSV